MTVIIDTRANCIAKKMGKKIPENVEVEPQRQGTKNMEISSPSFVCKGCYTESFELPSYAVMCRMASASCENVLFAQ